MGKWWGSESKPDTAGKNDGSLRSVESGGGETTATSEMDGLVWGEFMGFREEQVQMVR